MDCSTCEKKTAVAEPVPYIAHESGAARQERIITKLCIALVICIVLLACCVFTCFKLNKNNVEKIEAINQEWLDYLSQYDFESYAVDVSSDGGGNANYVGENGDIYNGTDNSTETDSETEGR